MQYRKYYYRAEHTEFLNQLTAYPAVPHDDLLDCIAIGLRALINPSIEHGEGEYSDDNDHINEDQYAPLPPMRRSP